jgi:hypothetical protein
MQNLTIDNLTLVVLVVLPGMVAIKAYDLLHPPEKRNGSDSLAEAILFSFLNLGIWLWLVLDYYRLDFAKEHPWRFVLFAFAMLFASPTGLALVWALLRGTKHFGQMFGYPTGTAWDDFFKRKQECWVLARLKTGGMVGGFFGVNSYVTSYPHAAEIYVEEAWKTNDSGMFVE